ncbi:hypothetical protein C9374_004221 [Naegleria lovaniensis]|uniref:pyridoxal kinase n=1 Tax=Naegleria lovaniensis TaxID=51637 RepID=A0AA88GSZ0_NAELO|nr:uncharacterized protein C9374_004221 [Naegleria lovaniensis]KAG2383550.1 hypothetical protein C9374_004221 [Naegleria lovaniensis]
MSQPTPSSSSGSSSLNGHVLSIQSHVVHGYVGNRSAVFPLQLLGFEVDFINSVQFSNHTGYRNGWKGQTLSGDELALLFEGLQMNNLEGSYTHLLTGYIGSETFLQNILHIHDKLIERNPKLIYVCDPVLGDAGKLYVPEKLIQIYREKVLNRATVITPNQFEAETLSGKKIKNEQDALDVIDLFHKEPYNIPVVVLTSAELEGDKESLTLYASNKKTQKKYRIKFKKLPGSFTGTGDVVSALFLAFYAIHGDDNFNTSLEKTLAGIQAVLEKTPPGEELRLIESRFVLLDPPIQYKAEQL